VGIGGGGMWLPPNIVRGFPQKSPDTTVFVEHFSKKMWELGEGWTWLRGSILGEFPTKSPDTLAMRYGEVFFLLGGIKMEINKIKYNEGSFFVRKPHEEYCNLEIYPVLNELEREAGLLSDFAEIIKANFISYGDTSLESVQFIANTITCFEEEVPLETKISRVDDSFQGEFTSIVGEVVLARENAILDKSYLKKIKIDQMDKVLYIKNEKTFDVFKRNFWYYFSDGRFMYDNLVCYTMIVKNGGPLLEEVLTANLPFVDRWCILDTGSTDKIIIFIFI
jgi:hypothetical protein